MNNKQFCAVILLVAVNNGVESNTGDYRQAITTCNKGQYVNATSRQCVSCPENTFNPDDNPTSEDCIMCKVEPPHEIQILPANGTHSPIFGCIDGYFFERFRHGTLQCLNVECGKCTNCSSHQFESIPCSNVCCEEEGMVVVNGKCTGREATTSTTPATNTTRTPLNMKCDRNQYLDQSNDTCQPCPPHTYMDKVDHRNNVCFNCSGVTGTDKPDGCRNVKKDFDVGLGVGIPAVIVIILVIILIYLYKKRKCKGFFRRNQRAEGHPHVTYQQTDTGSMNCNNLE